MVAVSLLQTQPGQAGERTALVAPPGGTTLVQTFPIETDLHMPGIPEAHTEWLNAIRGAKKEIRIEEFYVANRPGSRLEPILQALEERGRAGVKIYVLLDQTMIQNDVPSFDRLKAIPNAQVRIYPLKQINNGIVHAKTLTVDGEWLYIGSHNMDWRALEHIHEMGIISREKPLVAQLNEVFGIDWEIAGTNKLPRPRPGRPDPIPADGNPQLVGSPPEILPRGMTPALDALLKLINEAQSSVEIQLMDYSVHTYSKPAREWRVIDDALRAAAARGVRVRLLVSDWNTPQPGLGTLKGLVQAGVEVYVCTIPQSSQGFHPYSRVIHSKYMVVDGRNFWLGTSNWGHGYFLGSRNVELVFRNSTLATQGQAIFAHVLRQPYTTQVQGSTAFPPPRKEH